MPRPPKPWYRKDRGEWYVTIAGKRHRLGPDKDTAYRKFHAILATPPEAPVVVSPGTVAELVENFLEWCKANQAPRTFEWYRGRIGRIYYDVADLQAGELRPYHVQEVLDRSDWSDAYKAGIVQAIKRVVNWCVKQGYLDHSTIQGLTKPRVEPRDQVVSQGEFDQILASARNEQFRELARFVWYTGARPQEAIMIEARHLDEANNRLIVPPAEPKGKKKPRIIYLVDEALEIVKRCAGEYPSGPIFRNTKGRPWTAMSVACTFGRIQKKLGTRYCMYSLRHSYATHRLTEGCDAVTLAHLLGHADATMLAKVYANVGGDVEHMRRAAARTGNGKS
jgi:integrase